MSELKKVFRDCRKATYLIDKRSLGSISFKESVALRIHLHGCDACRIYKVQSLKINMMIRQLLDTEPKPGMSLDENFKTALRVQVAEQLDQAK